MNRGSKYMTKSVIEEEVQVGGKSKEQIEREHENILKFSVFFVIFIVVVSIFTN